MKYFRLGIAQVNPVVGDLEGNAARILSYLEQAKGGRVDFLIFPELCLCGYPPEDLLLKSSFIDDNLKALRQLQQAITTPPLVCLGFADRGEDGRIYNAAAVLDNQRSEVIYHKIHLPNYGVFDEKRYFSPGGYCCLFQLGDLKLGLTICEDLWYQDVIRNLSQDGAHLVLNISASPYHQGKGRLRERLFRKMAKENQVFLVYANLVGGQDELVFDGHSLVFDPKGRLLARGKSFEEELLLIDLPIDAICNHKHNYNYKTTGFQKKDDPKVKSYPIKRFSLPFQSEIKSHPCSSPLINHLSPLTEVYKALTTGIRDYVLKNGFKKTAIGLSGGIDSALTAALAVDALGAENVIGVIMPSRFSSSQTQNDAQRLADNLKIYSLWIPIHDLHQSYLHSLEKVFENTKPDITEENIQARIRGNLLMALSNKFGWLILTTGNKSETSVGYCTIYGDMAGGFAVIKDVLKTLVYHLTRYRNKQAGYDLIPNSIIDRAPSAELAPNQRDQDLLPPYPILDNILCKYVEKDESFLEIVAAGYEPALVRRIINMVDRNEYKRRQSPPGIKITPRAFGKDRRMPITNKYKQ